PLRGRIKTVSGSWAPQFLASHTRPYPSQTLAIAAAPCWKRSLRNLRKPLSPPSPSGRCQPELSAKLRDREWLGCALLGQKQPSPTVELASFGCFWPMCPLSP